MKKYILTKTAKGKKFLYEVKYENGKVISNRTSARDYVACTANSEFYFGRIDLIGKGEHGKMLSLATKILSDPKKSLQRPSKLFYTGLSEKMDCRKPIQ